MGRQVELALSDALFNSGILGFLRICQKYRLEVKINGTRISFDSDILQNFTTYYLQTMIDTFYDDTVYAEILAQHTRVTPLKLAEKADKENFDKCLKYIADKLVRNSYKSGMEIIRRRGEDYDFLLATKKIKDEPDYTIKIELLNVLIQKLKQYEDIFLLKDIAYTKIEPFWGGVAFLNSKHNKTEFHTCFAESFVEPAYNFVPKAGKKSSLSCCQCGIALTRSNSFAMSWIKDVGVDIARKTSYYWNFQVDSLLCPV